MRLFLSTFTNRIDKKGRVSVPASFRDAIRAAVPEGGFWGVVAFPSLAHEAIEGAGMDYIERLTDSIDQFAPFTDEFDAFTATILAASHQLGLDPEGRVVLPDELIAHAGLSDTVAFVGRGKTFQMWQPARFHEYAAEARRTARDNRTSLRWPEPKGGSA